MTIGILLGISVVAIIACLLLEDILGFRNKDTYDN
jgi:hypothetical protein